MYHKHVLPMKFLCLSLYLTCTLLITFAQVGFAQQRFLKILGQRPASSTNTSLSALEPRLGPFFAGIPTNATIVAALVDETGAVISTENRLRVRLYVQSPNDGQYARYVASCSQSDVVAAKGIFEFPALRVHGVISTSLTLIAYQSLYFPNELPPRILSITSATFALHGGAAYMTNWVKLKNGKYAMPGRGGNTYEEWIKKPFEGAIPNLQSGKLVRLNNPDTTDFNVLAVKVFDYFGNIALSTTAHITIVGGEPHVNPIATPVIGNKAVSDPITGIATFPDFQVLGETSNNVRLSIDVSSDPSLCYSAGQIRIWTPAANARINIIASNPVAVMPVIIPNPLNTQENVRIPPTMFAGRIAPTFYAQAVDEFGNRVSGDPSDPNGGYNGGVATITFPAPGVSIPNPDGSTTAVMNTQQWSATGTTATSLRGLYTFNSFMPNQPTSLMPFDVIMKISDPALNAGAPHPLTTLPQYQVFQPLPATTTASTTVSAVPRISLVAQATSSLATASGGILTLNERRATILGTETSSGQLLFQRPVGTAAYPAIIGYTLSYRDSSGKALPNTSTNSIGLPVPLPVGAAADIPAPTPVALNTLQGDLQPKTRAAVGFAPVHIANPAAPNAMTLIPGGLSQELRFEARWSDQVYPTTPARQGKRAVRVELLPDAAGTVYDVETTASVGMVILDDPRNTAPQVLNAIGSTTICPGGVDLFELETAGLRADGKPNAMFYSDNYYPFTYSLRLSQPDFATVVLNPKDSLFMGRPSLRISVPKNSVEGSKTTIEVTATDAVGSTAMLNFNITISTKNCYTVIHPTSIGLTVQPFIVSTYCTVEFNAPCTGLATIQLISLTGNILRSFELNLTQGQPAQQFIDLRGLSTGYYVILIQQCGLRTSKQLMILNETTAIEVTKSAKQSFFSLTPNPTTENITVNYDVPRSGLLTMRLLNVLGVELWSKERRVTAGEAIEEMINVMPYPAGMYLVELHTEQTRERRSIIKAQ